MRRKYNVSTNIFKYKCNSKGGDILTKENDIKKIKLSVEQKKESKKNNVDKPKVTKKTKDIPSKKKKETQKSTKKIITENDKKEEKKKKEISKFMGKRYFVIIPVIVII